MGAQTRATTALEPAVDHICINCGSLQTPNRVVQPQQELLQLRPLTTQFPLSLETQGCHMLCFEQAKLFT